jgi:zinc protease
MALELGMKILAGGTSSLVYEEFVNRQKIFSMVGGFYQGFARGEGYVYFYAIPNIEMSTSKINEKLENFIAESIDNKITSELLELEKKKYFFDSIYGIIGEALTIGLKLKDIENWNEQLNKITVEMVVKELKEFSNNKNFVTGSLKN